MSHDRKFFDTFLLILGALILFSVGMIVLSKAIGSRQTEFIAEDPEAIKALEERIAPVGKVAIEGQDEPLDAASAANIPAATTVVVASKDAPAAVSGEDTYNAACMVCHATGIAGAPKVGDVAGWTARIAQGTETLHNNAINGYQGASGVMPAKGGRMDLSDDAVRAAVDFMVSKSQ